MLLIATENRKTRKWDIFRVHLDGKDSRELFLEGYGSYQAAMRRINAQHKKGKQ